MKLSTSYVLVFDQQSDDLRTLEMLLQPLKCSVVVTNSVDQIMAIGSQTHPSLVILVGNDQHCSHALANQLRSMEQMGKATIVALTDFHAPRWLHPEENSVLDGFLVKPLSEEILTSLVQSAWARQTC
jgi:AmiR/NasT family two-component response regulator